MYKNNKLKAFSLKAEQITEKILFYKIFNSKNSLKDRICMYIFLFTSISIGMGMIGAQAYTEKKLIQENIISIQNTIYAKMAIVKK